MIGTLLASRRVRRVVIAAVPGVLAAGAIGALLAGGMMFPSDTTTGKDMSNVACPMDDVAVSVGDAEGKGGDINLTAEQSKNAQTIVRVGQQMKMPTRAHVVAIAAALQESGLRNLDYGDRDSLGLFQMRPSMGWGTRAQVTDPVYASKKFYNVLKGVKGWEQMSVNDAAQAVERSGFPNAYAQHERRAVQIVATFGPRTGGDYQQISSTGCNPQSDPVSSETANVVTAARSKLGTPYKWGATGPNSFDCSGLLVWAWRQAGQQINVRTSQEMYRVATPVKPGEEKPGDLLFSQFKGDGPAHVMMVVKRGTAIEAPRTGLNVRERKYDVSGEEIKIGRLPKSSMSART